MKLGQSEFVGALDEYGVCSGNIYSGLDNGRAEEQVVLLLQELAHHALEVALAHLSVRDRDARLGKELLEFFARDFNRGDVVVQETDLAAALQLPQCRLADNAGGVARDNGADRTAAFRR